MRKQGAASVSTVTLLDKVARRVVDLEPDYRGFEVCYPTMSHIILCRAKSASGSVTQACSSPDTATVFGQGGYCHTPGLHSCHALM